MATVTSISKPSQMIITLEDNALVADIKKALKLIRGVASVRVATISDDNTIAPFYQQSPPRVCQGRNHFMQYPRGDAALF